MNDLPDCNVLFERYFARWYPEQLIEARGRPAIKPDIVNRSELVGRSAEQMSPLPPEAQASVHEQLEGMLRAAEGDWPGAISVAKPVDERWVDAFDKSWPAKELANLISATPPDDYSNMYLVLCCEFGAVLGHVLRTKKPRLIWLADWPYWDSELIDPTTGISMPVFHWAMKKMSSYGVDDGFVAKINACVQLLEKYGGK